MENRKFLDERNVQRDPFAQFDIWFQEMLMENFREPTAMILATSTPGGKPSARTVLLKEFSQEGFVFYTNYQSRKGKELGRNPNAALLFYWDRLERQVRIEGRVKKVSAEQSDNYFNIRPRGSRIGAIASPQSKVIQSRLVLEKKIGEVTNKYQSIEDIPRPSHWGGFVLQPRYFEFWQGRPNRLHDRIVYASIKGRWKMQRLAP